MPGPEVRQVAEPSLHPEQSSAGKTLKRIFHQDDSLRRIEEQPASRSLLMNPARMDVFMHLCRKPCDHVRSIAGSLGKSVNGTNWHLKRLLECGYLETARVRGKQLYWPVEMIMPEDAPMFSALRHRSCISTIKAIIANGGRASQADIVKATGWRQQNVNVWLRNMVHDRILRKAGNGTQSYYIMDPDLPAKERSYFVASGTMSKCFIELFRFDGLLPKRDTLKGTRLSVMLSLPSGKKRAVLECNPMAPLTKVLSKL